VHRLRRLHNPPWQAVDKRALSHEVEVRDDRPRLLLLDLARRALALAADHDLCGAMALAVS
jgi:hypothetical protein